MVRVEQKSGYVDFGQDMTLVLKAGPGHRPEPAWAESTDTVDERGHDRALDRWRKHRRHHRSSELVGMQLRHLERPRQPLLRVCGPQRAAPAGVPTHECERRR